MVAEGDISKLSYIDNYSVEQSYITDSLIASVHKQNKEIFAFTVNDPDTIRKLADMGVDNIISDNPTLVRNILVHEYVDIDLTKIYEILHKHLDDFYNFINYINQFIEKN